MGLCSPWRGGEESWGTGPRARSCLAPQQDEHGWLQRSKRPVFLQIPLQKNGGERDNVPLQNGPVVLPVDAGGGIAAPLSTAPSISCRASEQIIWISKPCVFMRVLPGRPSSPTLPIWLVADGVCLIDPEYLKDRKGISTENPMLGG